MDNTGQFMAPAGGGGDAIKAAMTARGMDTSVLDQNTSSPNAVLPPAPMPPTGSAIPPNAGGQIDPSMVSSAPPMPSTPQGMGSAPSMGNPEKQIILKAMDQALKTINKVEEANAGIR